MHRKSLSTSSLRFPALPPFRPLCSRLVEGPDSCFGLVVSTETMSEGEPDRVQCIFCEWNLSTMHVAEQQIILPYRYLEHIQLGYDPLHSRWVMSLDARTRARKDDPTSYSIVVSDVYERHAEQGHEWKRILSLAPEKRTQKDRYVSAFWQHNRSLVFLIGKYYAGVMGTLFYSLPWSEPSPQLSHRLGSGVRAVPYVFDESFLLFICSCQGKRRQWQWRVAAYRTDGSRIRSYRVPGIGYQSTYEWSLALHDLDHWLHPTLSVSKGPYDEKKQRATCVAALGFKNRPTRARSPLATTEPEKPIAQEGVYCIDQNGHSVSREFSPLGDQVSLSLCGKKVLGVEQWGEQWHLWSWIPLQKKARKTEGVFAQHAQRVTIVSGDEKEQGETFWCVEEYQESVVVSLWKSEPLQKVDQMRIEGIVLPIRAADWSWGVQPCGIMAFHHALLLVGINRENQIQVIHVS